MLRTNQLSGFGAGGAGLRTISHVRFNGTDGFTGPFPDEAKPARVWTSNNGASITTAESYENGSSLALAGSIAGVGDFVSTTDIDKFDVGDRDFTIEAWVRITNSPDNFFLYVGRDDYTGFPFDNGTAHMLYQLQVQNGSGAFDVLTMTADGETFIGPQAQTGLQPPAAWHHHAVVRKDSSVRFFLDGVRVGFLPEDIGPGFVITPPLGHIVIGAYSFNPFFTLPTSTGHLYNWRVTLGARYDVNADFTVAAY